MGLSLPSFGTFEQMKFNRLMGPTLSQPATSTPSCSSASSFCSSTGSDADGLMRGCVGATGRIEDSCPVAIPSNSDAWSLAMRVSAFKSVSLIFMIRSAGVLRSKRSKLLTLPPART